ncbi:MAG: hypothetical protein AAB668_01800 [Patescibacteria group bacterium]
MNLLPVAIEKTKAKRGARSQFVVKMDAQRFERLANVFGYFNPDFLKSLDRAEEDARKGRVHKINSLKDLE